jgi:glucosamine kinase
MHERLFIGVDGGGSRTRARLCDPSGAILGEGEAGPGNVRLGDAGFAEVLTACRQAITGAGLGDDDLNRIHAGFGLAGTQQDVDLRAVLARPHPFASLVVDTDAYAACLGAHGGEDGAILILGTGAAGLLILDGKRVTVGGWGAEIADDGSGMAIGRAAIRRSLWAVEGMAPLTPLAEDILAPFDGDPANAVVWAGSATPGDYARFAPKVFDHADRRDPLAVAIVQEAAGDAARMIDRLLDLGAPKIAMIGSIFPPILPWLPPPLHRSLIEPMSDAMAGAILMAERSLQGIGTGRL